MQNIQSLKNLTLLFVEDEPLLQQQTSDMLAIFFDRVVVANNGVEALKRLASEEIDIVLSDIRMPLLDGVSLVKHIRSMGNQIPFVIISSFSDQNTLLDAANAGIDGYIVKPIVLNELLQTLIRVLNRKNLISQQFSLGKNLLYNNQTQELYFNNEVIELGRKERELLQLLITNAPRTMTKEKILAEIWNDEYVSDSAIKNMVGRLRKKVGTDVIVSVKGAGWRLAVSE